MSYMKVKILPSSLIILHMILILSCKTQQGNNNIQLTQANLEQYNISLNDSLMSIICDAKGIKCQLLLLKQTDSIIDNSIYNVPCDLKSVIKFLVTDSTNFISNDIVYGIFSPCVKYIFEASKDRKVEIELDFGLSKWRLFNATREVITTADMKVTNLQLLRATQIIYPNDSTLYLLNKNLMNK